MRARVLSPNAIEISGLWFAYPAPTDDATPDYVLRGVDLAVHRGEFLALMGPMASGKSTLCMALNGLVPQATGGTIRGSVRVLGCDALRTPLARLASVVGVVRQDAESQLVCATVEDDVAFGPENLGLPTPEIRQRVDWSLDVVGMSRLRSRAPWQLSGGQKQRVAIAAALAMRPDILVLDDPTAMLDPVGQNEVFAVVEGLCGGGMTLVMVTHDAERVADFADRVAILAKGRIVRCAAPAEVLTDAPLLESASLEPPQLAQASAALNARLDTSFSFHREKDATAQLEAWLAGRG